MVRLLRTLAIALLMAAFAVVRLSAVPARADTPGCTSPHCYAQLRTGNANSTQYQGMYGTWNRAAMSAGCTSASHTYVDSEMWFFPLGGGWVEAGHTAGWLSAGGSCDYYAFGAWEREDGSGYKEVMLQRLDHNDATTDEFQISRSGTRNTFNIYFNGNRKTTDDVQFWNSRRFFLGGEVSADSGTSHTFNMTARAIDSSGALHLLTSPQSGYVSSNSLSGTSPGNSAWTWRVKP